MAYVARIILPIRAGLVDCPFRWLIELSRVPCAIGAPSGICVMPPIADRLGVWVVLVKGMDAVCGSPRRSLPTLTLTLITLNLTLTLITLTLDPDPNPSPNPNSNPNPKP